MQQARHCFVWPLRLFLRLRSAACALGLLLVLAVGPFAPARAAPADPSGLWWTKNNGSIIKIVPCAKLFCGTLVWLKEPNKPDGTPKTDIANEDESKRARPVIGIQILIDLKSDGDHWQGQAYNPEDGKTYDVDFKVMTGGDTAEIRGCVLKILCKTDTFTKAQAVPKPLAVQP
ncbi:DUF2147 domain-containing protein [Beijerinckiaceae bacterium]|nr:DUF2147 domain-containing protein [Beijerinckiaceae bacterium]